MYAGGRVDHAGLDGSLYETGDGQSRLQVIAVLDHSKFGEVSLTTIVPLSQIDVIVTDDGIDKTFRKELEQMGIQVVIAE